MCGRNDRRMDMRQETQSDEPAQPEEEQGGDEKEQDQPQGQQQPEPIPA